MNQGEFTGYKRAGFPYLNAANEDQNIYSPDCVPEGFSLIDPDHITGFNITKLYNHWLLRQKNKLEPFIILNPGPLHQAAAKKSKQVKGKAKAYVPVSTDDEDGADSSDDGGEGGKKKSTGGAQSDEEEEEAVRPKIGPPRGKKPPIASSSRLPIASSSRLEDGPSQAAGSSTQAINYIPLVKKQLGKKKAKGTVSEGLDEEDLKIRVSNVSFSTTSIWGLLIVS